MPVFMWENDLTQAGRPFRPAVERAAGASDLEIYSDPISLQQRLRRPGSSNSVAVLVAHTREDLYTAVSLRDFLSELKVILILPDRDKATVALGHSMNPRYLTYVDSDPDDVAAVLTRMVEFMADRNPFGEFERSVSR
jgi:hypothetical protein